LLHVEDPLVNTAGGVTVLIAVALVNSILKHAFVPAIDKVSMITISSGIAMRKDKRLRCVHGLGIVEAGIPVKFHENAH